jgi:hypothetical protein
MMESRDWERNLLLFLASFLLLSPFTEAQGKSPASSDPCGKAKVALSNPKYLTVSTVTIAVELPPGWALETTRKNPFYFLKSGEKYENARTLMYANVERLDGLFENAVQKDKHTFSESCRPSQIEDQAKPDILEAGCESKTQIFRCEKQKGAYIDLATKISVGGLLLNVVLSADNEAEILRNRKEYEFLLKHLALVN